MTGDPLELLLRGAAEEIPKGGLKAALARVEKEGRPLRVKFGIDPSSADLHLGHTVPLRKLKAFQDLGHEVIFLIGDFTAQIGDPTGRNAARPQLTKEQVAANAKTYLDQVWKVLDRGKTNVRYNSEWCEPMTFADVIRLASKQNVARILERDDFSKRHKAGIPIAVHEFLYPLVQGYDSVVLKADVELCSTDQIFNCHGGRALQEADGQPPAVILAMPLIEGTDGVAKMSKSSPEHAIGITERAKDMFGKLMSIPDALVEKYCTLLLDPASHSHLETMRAQLHEEGLDKEANMAAKAM
ncbi:MAG: tyrosine--tRNA ligase, partial [bacterium]